MTETSKPHSTQDAASKLTAWLEYERTPFDDRPAEHEFGWQYDPRNDVQSLLEQLEAADEKFRLIAEACGEEGVTPDDWRAMTHPTHAEFALRAVRQLRADYDEALEEIPLSNPAKRPE